MHNRLEAAKLLLQKGADINAIPAGFDYAGTGLHNAALRGHRTMVDFLLEHGANPNVKDSKVNSLPSGWADYGGHKDLSNHLEQIAKAQNQPHAG
jgi:ankyrin repeat protein